MSRTHSLVLVALVVATASFSSAYAGLTLADLSGRGGSEGSGSKDGGSQSGGQTGGQGTTDAGNQGGKTEGSREGEFRGGFRPGDAMQEMRQEGPQFRFDDGQHFDGGSEEDRARMREMMEGSGPEFEMQGRPDFEGDERMDGSDNEEMRRRMEQFKDKHGSGEEDMQRMFEEERMRMGKFEGTGEESVPRMGNFYDEKIEGEYFGHTEERRPPNPENLLEQAIGILEEVIERVSGTPAQDVLTDVIAKLREQLSGSESAEDPFRAMQKLISSAKNAAEEAMRSEHGAAPREFGPFDRGGAVEEMRRVILEITPQIFSIFELHQIAIPAVSQQTYDESVEDFRGRIEPLCGADDPECKDALMVRQQAMQENIVEPMMGILEALPEGEQEIIMEEINAVVLPPEFPGADEFMVPPGEEDFRFEDEVQQEDVGEMPEEEWEVLEQ